MHGRPTSISHNEIDVDLPQDLEEFECEGQPKAFVNMSAMIHLSTRLGEISHAM